MTEPLWRDVEAKIDRLRWSLAAVRKEICAASPDWGRALRILAQSGYTEDSSTRMRLANARAIIKRASQPPEPTRVIPDDRWIKHSDEPTRTASPPPARPASVPEGESIYLPKITRDLCEQFEGTGLIEMESDWQWSQAAVDLACILKAQVLARTAQPPPAALPLAHAIDTLREIVKFAYQQGLHEMGYDPVDELLRLERASTPPPGVLEALEQVLLYADFRSEDEHASFVDAVQSARAAVASFDEATQTKESAPPSDRLHEAERLLRECLEDLDFESANAELLSAAIDIFLDGASVTKPATRHAVTCELFPDPNDERDPAGPCTCGALPEPELPAVEKSALNDKYKDRERIGDHGEMTPRMEESLDPSNRSAASSGREVS